MHATMAEKLEERVSPAAVARIRSQAGTYAGAWLNALPEHPSCAMRDDEFRAAVCTRLGVRVRQFPAAECPCGARLESDDATNHSLGCARLKHSVSSRHNAVQQVLAETLRAAGASVQLEPPTGIDDRRLDLIVTAGSRRWALDVSLVNPSMPSYVAAGTGTRAGAVCAAAEQEKIEKYDADARRLGCTFRPFVLDVYGHFGVLARKFLLEVATKLSEIYGHNFTKLYARLVNGVSATVQKGNAACIYTAAAYCFDSNAGALGRRYHRRAASAARVDAAAAAAHSAVVAVAASAVTRRVLQEDD
jgi:hypothetical protein